jgi:hypothetical protein
LRRNFARPAGLFHPDGKRIRGCVMRDISATGARLKADRAQSAAIDETPSEFILTIAESGKRFVADGLHGDEMTTSGRILRAPAQVRSCRRNLLAIHLFVASAGNTRDSTLTSAGLFLCSRALADATLRSALLRPA